MMDGMQTRGISKTLKVSHVKRPWKTNIFVEMRNTSLNGDQTV
jgi:hypothetical protein